MSKTLVSQCELERFRTIVARQAGLRWDDDKLPWLRSLLESRVAHKGLSVGAYLDDVAPTRAEIAELARSLSVNETYFFRNDGHFAALTSILRARQDSGARHLRMLSAGCSSGEEPYSLAITALDTLDDPQQWNITIVGIDLDSTVIEKARAAEYGAWSLRGLPERVRRRYFHRRGKRHVLDDVVRKMVRFEQQNLVGAGTLLWRPEAYDVVFFRNVLMYFTRDTVQRVLSEVEQALSANGHLFIGHAENLRGLALGFDVRQSHDTFYYQRRTSGVRRSRRGHRPGSTGASTPAAPDASWFDAIGRASRKIQHLSHRSAIGAEQASPVPVENALGSEPSLHERSDLAAALRLVEREHFHQALELVANAPVSDPDAMLVRAAVLMNLGRLEDATTACQQILSVDELHAGAHAVMALVREHLGDCAGAVEHGRVAVYLDRDFAMPRLQLGRLARRVGDESTARRELRLALGLLPREDAARIVVFGGGFSREALMQLCRGELQACGGHP